MPSAYSRAMFAQIDQQLDTWRARASSAGTSRFPPPPPVPTFAPDMHDKAYSNQHVAAPRAASAAPSDGAGALTAADIADIVAAQMRPLLQRLEADGRRNGEMETIVKATAAKLDETRRSEERLRDECNGLKAAMSDAQMSLRAAQEEVTSLRHRVHALERDGERDTRYTSHGERDAAPADGDARHSANGGKAGMLSVQDLVAVLGTVLGGSGAGERRALAPASIGSDADALRALRGELGWLRDDLRAEIRFAIREHAHDAGIDTLNNRSHGNGGGNINLSTMHAGSRPAAIPSTSVYANASERRGTVPTSAINDWDAPTTRIPFVVDVSRETDDVGRPTSAMHQFDPVVDRGPSRRVERHGLPRRRRCTARKDHSPSRVCGL
jgi:hypothetical protein